MYIEGIDYRTLEDELRYLFETEPLLSPQANAMFDRDTWEDVYGYVEIRDEGLGFVVTYDGTMVFVDDLLAEYLNEIANVYGGTFIMNY
jgi:hypothetical protein